MPNSKKTRRYGRLKQQKRKSLKRRNRKSRKVMRGGIRSSAYGEFRGKISNHIENLNGVSYHGEANKYMVDGTNKIVKQGKGRMTWHDGQVYEGEWKDNVSHGKGKLSWSNGAIYEGEFKDDKMNGRGKLTLTTGAVYEGEWKDDDMMP